MGPGPGSYKPLESMGKQVLSTKHAATVLTHSLTHSLTQRLTQSINTRCQDSPKQIDPQWCRLVRVTWVLVNTALSEQHVSLKLTQGRLLVAASNLELDIAKVISPLTHSLTHLLTHSLTHSFTRQAED